MTPNEPLPPGVADPAAILGVAAQADAATLRAAYLEKVRQYPPARCPAEFERVRDAYAVLSDPRRRVQVLLRQADPLAPLAGLLPESETETRRFVGLEPWLEALRRHAEDPVGEQP